MRVLINKSERLSYKLAFMLCLAVIILAAFVNGSVWAQEQGFEPQVVIAYNDLNMCGDQVWRMTLQVWNVGSDGGEAYAQAIYSGYDCINGRIGDIRKEEYGTFSGGPNGIVTIELARGYQVTWQFVDGKTVAHIESGATIFTVQNPEAFDAWRTEPITSEYIYKTYGIRVEDSYDEPGYEQKSWSDQELILLNDVLKELPPGLLKRMAITRIVRNKIQVDENGNPKPKTVGAYYPCGSPPEKDCTSSSGVIRVFDLALTPSDFSDDPNGHKQFKGTILHELTHALQAKKDEYSIYKNDYASPVVQNYMDAILPVTDIYSPFFNYIQNGWQYGHPPGQPPPRWKLFGFGGGSDEVPPTAYGLTNPLEDMCESMMMYVYEPQKLRNSSQKRYNFIRDLVFEGVEYENGAQKRP